LRGDNGVTKACKDLSEYGEEVSARLTGGIAPVLLEMIADEFVISSRMWYMMTLQL
jgi:predicted glycosyl hydrolase (DUF1957 family)